MIFYAIYKKQPKHFYYLSYQLQGGPRKDSFLCNVAPGAVADAGWANSGEARRSLAGEGREEGLGVTRVLFGSSVGGERLPVGGTPAASGGGRCGCPTDEVGARLGL
jgi:hypothetical protein